MLAHRARGFPAAAVPYPAAHYMVMVRRLHCRVGVTTDTLDEHCIVGGAGDFLLVHVGPRTSLQAVPFHLPSARDLRGAKGIAKRQHFIRGGVASGGHHHCPDDFRVEQPGFVGSQLGVGSTSLVPGRNSMAVETSNRVAVNGSRKHVVALTPDEADNRTAGASGCFQTNQVLPNQ